MRGKVSRGRDLKENSEKLEKTNEERTKELQLLRTINTALKNGSELDEILSLIAIGVKSTFNYIASAVYLLSDDEKHLILKEYSTDRKREEGFEKITGEGRIKGWKIPLFEGSIFKDLIETKEPLLNPDPILYWSHFVVPDSPLRQIASDVTKFAKEKSRINVTISAEGKVIGVIAAFADRELTENDKKILVSFGEQVGLAVQTAKLHEDKIKELEHKEYLGIVKDIVK